MPNEQNRLNKTEYKTKYPYSQVTVTEAGHEVHFDNTPGAERIRIAHRKGTYAEIGPDGKLTVFAVGNRQEYNKGGVTITVDENSDVKIAGHQRICVGGGSHIEVAGDAAVTVGGDSTSVVGGNMKAAVAGDSYIGTGGTMNMNAGGKLNISAPAGIEITGDIKQNGKLASTGTHDASAHI